jgi:Animal haem peroxidase/RTX calcium-binding nonapeptide repeat (4 copies)/Cadherin domain
MATNYTTSFNINADDLQYILKQIKIAEATSIAYNSEPLSILDSIIATYGGDANSAALLPAGLRTVDGTFNNLRVAPTGSPGDPNYNPGTSQVGAADTLFPRLTDPVFRTVDGPGIDFNGDGIIDVINHNYLDGSPAPGTQIRSVADADPRTISNLIVDMSVNNPAAIAAYLGNPLSLEQFAADHPGMNPVAPGTESGPNDLAVTDADLRTMPNQSPDIGLSPGFNSWMTFFGQFFDHGLDLVTKGANGTVYIPLTADDPLYDKGADGIANNVVDAFFVTDPALVAPGDPLPAVSGVNTGFQAFYLTDPADRASYPPGSFSPALTATPTTWAVQFNDDGFGADGLVGTADDRPNFMALTRATATLDANGIPQTENTTTPWIDQNQTYTSNASHQVFLREYKMLDLNDGNGPHTVSTGRLIDGTTASGSSNGAIGNWGEVKAQALTMLGIKLSDHDVNNVPLLLTDQYGKFIPGANGYAQLVMAPDATHLNTWLQEGTATGISTDGAERTNHAFLNDIAHHAAPGFVDLDHDGFKESKQVADADQDTNHNGKFDFVDNNTNGIFDDGDTTDDILTDVNGDGFITTADFFADDGNALTYDDEMLESHFITGDGRGNENIGLSTVHSIFHSEHNRAVEADKATILANAADATLNSADHALAVAFLNEWLLADVAADSTTDQIAAIDPASLVWDGERLFQAGRFSTEMQYQHLVFEEFARRIQPAIDPFIFTNSADLDPSIVAEFAHTVYRFGHSMLTGTVDRLQNDLTNIHGGAATDQDTLLAVFLNPQAYSAGGVDAATINADLIRGLSRDVGNAMDEFIVTDVRSNLLGLPLDLAALNIARGRDTGIPSLNETRAQIYASTGLADLKPYANWAEFAAAITNPASIINFIAAYGTHASILAATTMAEMRDAAAKLVFGDDTLTGQAAIDFDNDRFDFLSASGIYADSPTDHHLGGMNDIDLWIGGLAEAHPEFGGMLGTTFNYVFEYQLESLQNGDRMYYLSRTQGLNFVNQLEPNTFADLVMRNTELGDIYSTHLNGFLFVTPDHFLELDRGIAQEDYDDTQAAAGLNLHNDPLWAIGEAHSILTPLKVTRSYTGASSTIDPLTGITHDVGGSIKFVGGEHVVIGGTEGNDKIWSDKGIDTLWGDGGDDYLNAGTESDNVFGGSGDDIIEDPFGDDLLRGNQGNDVITSARGADIFFGDQGQDYIIVGQDAGEVFAGQDDDFVLGGLGSDGLMGNEGNDWIEGGEGFDGLSGENSQLFFNSTIIGHDVLIGQGNDTDYDGESGDDIMVEGAGIQRNNGMFGFDWGIHKNDVAAANSDLGIPIFATQLPFTLRDRFDSVEGLSGWDKDDTLTGAAIARGGALGFGAGPGNPVDESDLKAKNVNLINGLDKLLGLTQEQLQVLIAQELAQEAVAPVDPTARRSDSVIDITSGAEIIIGGGGNDIIKGNLGNDILDGDAWLNVRIKIVHAGITYSAESMNTSTLAMGQYAGKVFNTFADGTPDFSSPAFGGASLNSLMLNRTLNPGDLSIVREILYSTTAATDVDTAVYNDVLADYTVTLNVDGSLNIAHTTPVVGGGVTGVDDGTDTVRNFELYQFADGTYTQEEILGLVVNFPPTITSNGGGVTAVVNVAENGTTVTTVTATDPDIGATQTYSISGGADAALFAIDSVTGVLTFVGAPDFEAPADAGGDNVYDVIVQVTDDTGLTDTQAIAVTVTNVNEAPVITSAAAVNAAENGTAAATVVATDVDAGTTLTYTITGGADAALFVLDQDTGVLSFVNAPDFEAPADAGGDNVYDVIVQVSDGALTDTQAIAVTVTNVNEAPTITSNGGADLATAIDENTTAVTTVTATDVDAGTTLTYSISGGADQSKFTIDPNTGVLSFITAPDFEVPTDVGGDNVYDVTVQVSDEGGLTDTQAIAVTVNDVVETVNLAPTDIIWNGLVPSPTARPGAGAVIANLSTVDPDNVSGFTYSLRPGSSAGFAVSAAGVVTTTTGLAQNATYTLILRSSDGIAFYDETFVVRVGAGGADVISGTGVDNVFYGLSNDDTLNGFGGNDTIFGQSGSDTINGGDGNDVINGGSGADILNGDAGNDSLNGGMGSDVLAGGVGDDTLDGGPTGNDTAVFAGNAGDFQYGQTSLTIGNASQGTDTLLNMDNVQFTDRTLALNVATGGNNTINGSNVAELILGLAGNDILRGGQGADVLVGGTGNDTFDFNAVNESGITVATRDIVADFVQGLDKLDFNTIDANSGVANNQNFTFNATAGAAITAAGQLVYHYEIVSGQEYTVVEGNVNANNAADFQVALIGHYNLTAADIVG